jgi:hypothetical protein
MLVHTSLTINISNSRIEVAYQEAVALKRQEELIREEEAAGLAEIELKAKRSAAEKEKRAKKKQVNILFLVQQCHLKPINNTQFCHLPDLVHLFLHVKCRLCCPHSSLLCLVIFCCIYENMWSLFFCALFVLFDNSS